MIVFQIHIVGMTIHEYECDALVPTHRKPLWRNVLITKIAIEL